MLRPRTLAAGLRNLGMSAVRTVLQLFLYRALARSPAGARYGFHRGSSRGGGRGHVERPAGPAPGVGHTLLLTGCEELAWLSVPLALVLPPLDTVMTAMVISSLWLPIWNATVTTLRQQATAPHLLGRVHATARTVNLSTIPSVPSPAARSPSSLPTPMATGGLMLALTISAVVAALSLPTVAETVVRP